MITKMSTTAANHQPITRIPPPQPQPQVVCCASCGAMLVVSPVVSVFACPCCQLPQMIPSNPKQKQLVLAHPNIDPALTQVICGNCLFMFYVPRTAFTHLHARFQCPRCRILLTFDISDSSLPPQAKEGNGERINGGVASTSLVKEKGSISKANEKKRARETEEDEDCFILDFNPFKSVDFSTLSNSPVQDDDDDEASEISILGQKGQVACRDYPHQRHLCGEYPFNKTAHESHCKMCYCYICDVPAPCKEWTKGSNRFRHCDATSDVLLWDVLSWKQFKQRFKRGRYHYQC